MLKKQVNPEVLTKVIPALHEVDVVKDVNPVVFSYNPDKQTERQVECVKKLSKKLLEDGKSHAKSPVIVDDKTLIPQSVENPNLTEKPNIVFLNLDAIEAAKWSTTNGYNRTLVIDLANRKVIGGGWELGAKAQEESLFYRTNLFVSLYELSSKTPKL